MTLLSGQPSFVAVFPLPLRGEKADSNNKSSNSKPNKIYKHSKKKLET
jgi:hypothetical protein